MSKWHSLLEYLQFPLKVLFFATMLLGIGSILTNPNLAIVNTYESNMLSYIAQILKYSGAIIISMFPLLIYLKTLSKKFVDSAPMMIGMFSLIVIMIIVMVFVKADYPTYYYQQFLGIEVQNQTAKQVIDVLQAPYKMGIFPYIVAYYITKFSYQRSRHHVRHGLFYFIDHDSWALLIALILSVLSGLAFSFVWPYAIETMEHFFAYVASDINNPLQMFFYGIFERICDVLNLMNIPRSVFWLSEAGGSWIDGANNAYLGDVSIWQATLNTSDINTTSGQFISAYYIINLFLIPAFLIGYYTLMGKKKNRRKYLVFIMLACVLSIFCGNPLAMELCMLVISPLLYACYLLLVGFSFALTTSLEAFIGFSYDGSLLTAMPGNLIDLLAYFNHINFYQSIVTILIIGIVLGILFYLATLFYFKKAAIGLLSMNNAESVAVKVIKAMGGIENVVEIDATPDKLIASFKSRDIVDLDELHKLGAYLILESRDGYYIRLGNISIMVSDEINKMLARHKQENLSL
ncbi:MAG: hypothetical protein EOM50_10380 [Erysipelotrichia bacterium]|nr:hypothetical protein [Erysipelotrichia bacterium]